MPSAPTIASRFHCHNPMIGTTDGDIQIVSGAGADDSKVITLHHSPITRIELSPGGGWVMSEDAGDEQRLWLLPNATTP